MKLNYMIEQNDKLNREHILHAMREIMLEGGYAPMNVDLFYDQFFNIEHLSKEGKQKLSTAKKSWLSVAEDFTYYSDFGLNDNTIRQINKIEIDHPNCKIGYRFLNANCKISSKLSDIKTYKDIQNLSSSEHIFKFTSNIADNYLKENKLHEHLPSHFKTFYDSALHSNSSKPFPRATRVIFESPFNNADMNIVSQNTEYAAYCITKLLIENGKAPMASHLLYTRMLDDFDERERELGINAGLEYGRHAEETIIAIDRGFSTGMRYGVKNAIAANRPFKCFTISEDKKIKEQVDSLDSLEKIEDWISGQKSKNFDIFESTGFIHEVPNIKLTESKSKMSVKI